MPLPTTIAVVADAERVKALDAAGEMACLAARLLNRTPTIGGSSASTIATRLHNLGKECDAAAKDIAHAYSARSVGQRRPSDAIHEGAGRADEARTTAERELAEFKRLIGAAVAEATP